MFLSEYGWVVYPKTEVRSMRSETKSHRNLMALCENFRLQCVSFFVAQTAGGKRLQWLYESRGVPDPMLQARLYTSGVTVDGLSANAVLTAGDRWPNGDQQVSRSIANTT